jgi:rhodanese-related sulfurtransferase
MTPTSNAPRPRTPESPPASDMPDVAFDIDVRELKRRLDAGESLPILDVREPEEFRLVNLGGQLMPFGILPVRMDELERTAELIVVCHHGNRSWVATELLRKNGFARARNLAGGIDAWSRLIDPSVPRY